MHAVDIAEIDAETAAVAMVGQPICRLSALAGIAAIEPTATRPAIAAV